MSNDYTPTTEDMAHAIGEWAYRTGHPENQDRPELLVDDGETMLARWLAAHDAEVAAKALEKAADELARYATTVNAYSVAVGVLRARAAEIRKGAAS